jgi:hypothetical protein
MNETAIPPTKEIEALMGQQFPGGAYRIAHWDYFLLSGCTGAGIRTARRTARSGSPRFPPGMKMP